MRNTLLVLLIIVLLTVAAPVAVWMDSGSGLVLLFVPAVLVLWLATIVWIGLWDSHGSVLDLIRGQFDPEPRRIQRDIHLREGQTQAAYAVRIGLDLEKPVGEVAPQYLSFAIDMSQVVAGRWWNPRADQVETGSGTVHAPLFDFHQPRLDLLTRALAPAYLRIGGSESDKVCYDLRADGDAPPRIPPGYQSVLTRQQWDAVHGFAQRNGLQVVCTLNAGPACRRSDGSWNEENAAELMTYTMQQGQAVAVWELGNEVNVFWSVHGLGSEVSVDQYRQDVNKARELVDRCSPGAKLAGQGSAVWPVLGEPLSFFFGFLPSYLQQTGDVLDVVSWHYYPQQSRRGPAASRRACPSRLLDPRNLDEAGYWAEKMRMWRNRWAPGKQLWLGETGNAQFGGEPGVSDAYIGGLWWLDQLGLLARLGHDVVVRQTLCGMNYGLIDDEGLEPRPDYWNSLLWKRLMGTRVYTAQATGEHRGKMRVYAQSTPGAEDGAVTVLAINLDHRRSATLSFPGLEGHRCEIYQVTSPDVLGKTVLLNGTELKVRGDGHLPEISGTEQRGAGAPTVDVLPLAYTFTVFRPR